jgi:hypothetical protein
LNGFSINNKSGIYTSALAADANDVTGLSGIDGPHIMRFGSPMAALPN